LLNAIEDFVLHVLIIHDGSLFWRIFY